MSDNALENFMLQQGIQRFRKKEQKAQAKGKQYTTPLGLALGGHLTEPFANAIHNFVLEGLNGKAGRRTSVIQYLILLEPKVIAHFACRTIVDTLSRSMPITKIAFRIGAHLEKECNLQKFSQHMPAYYFTLLAESTSWTTNIKRRCQRLLQSMAHKGVEPQLWSTRDKILIGIKLIDLFLEVTGIVKVASRRMGNKVYHFLEPTAEALELIQQHNEKLETLKPVYGPLRELPWDWTDIHTGGFHTLPLCLIKTTNREHLEHFKKWNMPVVYKAINALQRTPYRINRPIYEVARALKDRGLALAGLPHPYVPEIHGKTGWSKDSFDLYRQGQELLNRNLEIEMTLRCAYDYIEDKAIYFVHTLDFRGRAYPVTSYLSPQGNDLNRGLLTFAQEVAQPLGNDGACWLAIHGANCWGQGVDKNSLEDRIAWTLENEDKILRCAADPLAHYWWTEADAPFQFLAFCFEWANYDKEGEEYRCSLPVAVDGSNNALQHFSALLKDEALAKATNLTPTDYPQDIYQEVCDEVNSLIKEDAAKGIKEAQQWQGHVTRKDVKRPVMTHCYGANHFGFSRQIIEDTLKPWFDSGKAWPFEGKGNKAAIYLASILKQALTKRVQAAEGAMKWLRSLAGEVAKHNLPVRWITPAEFPVVHKSLLHKTKQLKTHIYGKVAYLNYTIPQNTLNTRQQINGVSAHYVHSLDAAAMMLTVEFALRNEVKAFRMIHDSYATVPADIPTLNFCLRQIFIEIYAHDNLKIFEDDVFAYLPASITQKIKVIQAPCQGSFDLKYVHEADYFFS